jgi:hypothetical protein
VTVPASTTTTLSPGNYGALSVTGTVYLNAGSYTFSSVVMANQAHFAGVSGTATVSVAGAFQAGNSVSISSPGSAPAGQLVIAVAGSDSGMTPAFSIGTGAALSALLSAPNGTLSLGASTIATGAFAGFDVKLGTGVTINYQSGFTEGQPAPGSLTADGPSPASIYQSYVQHNPPPLNATGAGAAAQVAAFIVWAGNSLPNEREDGRGVLAGATSNADIANALIAQYNAAVSADPGLALLILSLLGELKSNAGEAFLITITQQSLPTTGTLADGEILERTVLEELQSQAVDGIAYRNTSTGNTEVLRLAQQSTSFSVRAEAVRAYLFNNPSTGRATLSSLLATSDLVLLDRVEHGPDQTSTTSFDDQLAGFLDGHPELVPPNPASPDGGGGISHSQDTAVPASANPIP